MAKASGCRRHYLVAVQSFEQALEDPQMHAAGVFVDMPKADGASYTAPASPIQFGDESTDPKGPSPE